MAPAYRHKNTSVSLINYHFVWVPRRRRKVLLGEIEDRCRQLIYEAASRIDCKVLALEIMPEHIHLFLNCPPTEALDQMMFRIKGYSARFLRKEFPQLLKMPSMWTRSDFVSTAGNVSSVTIMKYIANQKTRD